MLSESFIAAPFPVVRVVIADDQRLFADSMSDQLGIYPGIHVVGLAADGQAALEVVLSTEVDVLLLDLSMPRLGGLEVLLKIREAAPSVKVIVLTSYPRSEYEAHALAAGAVAYLQKDTELNEIVRTIRAVAAT